MTRYLGCLGLGVLYSLFAAYMFAGIMMGDCNPEPVADTQCEANRAYWLWGLIALSVIVTILLVWAFFVRGRKQNEN